MADKPIKGDIEVNIVDKDTQKSARIDSSGRILVSPIASTPPSTTSVIQTGFSSISTSTDTIYTITNTKTLVLQQFEAGAQENTTGGSKVILYEDPNGDLSVLNLITLLYVNGDSSIVQLSSSFVGNGTRRIVMRRDVISGPSREVFGRWKGFEE